VRRCVCNPPHHTVCSRVTQASDWEVMPCSTAQGRTSPVAIVAWGPGNGLLAASCADGSTSILSETILHRLLQEDVGVIQLSSNILRIERQMGAGAILKCDISIRGVAISSCHVNASV
jgi:intraflagellar transport protein 140